jgi:hypothetical protein
MCIVTCQNCPAHFLLPGAYEQRLQGMQTAIRTLHDIQNPLGAIKNYTPPPDVANCGQRSYSWRPTRLINELSKTERFGRAIKRQRSASPGDDARVPRISSTRSAISAHRTFRRDSDCGQFQHTRSRSPDRLSLIPFRQTHTAPLLRAISVNRLRIGDHTERQMELNTEHRHEGTIHASSRQSQQTLYPSPSTPSAQLALPRPYHDPIYPTMPNAVSSRPQALALIRNPGT